MGLYNLLSLFLTGVGYTLLTYRSSFILSQNHDEKQSLLEPLGMKWVVFILFLIFQPTLQTILDIVPFGLLALLAIKCIIVLPQNTLSTHIYKKIQKQLQKLEFEQYNTKLSIYTSAFCKFIVLKLIKLSRTLAIYVKTGELQSIYLQLQETLVALEYKRMTVQAKHELGKSKLQRQMSFSLNDSTQSISENDLQGTEPQIKPSTNIRQSQVFNRMSIINIGNQRNKKQSDQQQIRYEVEAQIMTVKPNKAKGIKPSYELGTVRFTPNNKQIEFIYKNSGRSGHSGVLNEIKYVKVNMMVIELILENDPSVVIKFLKEGDVFPWVKPVMTCLNSH